MPRSATFLARAGMRMVMARLLASLKSAISLAPLRSSPGPSMLDVTSITIGRRSRTLPPRQSSTSPAANLARSASSKPAASVSLLWARAGAAAAVAVAERCGQEPPSGRAHGRSVRAEPPPRRVIELWLAGEPAGNKPADESFRAYGPFSQVPGLDGRHSGGPGRRRDRDRVFLCHVGRFPRPHREPCQHPLGPQDHDRRYLGRLGLHLARPSERRCSSPMPSGPRNPTCSRPSRSISRSACGLC